MGNDGNGAAEKMSVWGAFMLSSWSIKTVVVILSAFLLFFSWGIMSALGYTILGAQYLASRGELQPYVVRNLCIIFSICFAFIILLLLQIRGILRKRNWTRVFGVIVSAIIGLGSLCILFTETKSLMRDAKAMLVFIALAIGMLSVAPLLLIEPSNKWFEKPPAPKDFWPISILVLFVIGLVCWRFGLF